MKFAARTLALKKYVNDPDCCNITKHPSEVLHFSAAQSNRTYLFTVIKIDGIQSFLLSIKAHLFVITLKVESFIIKSENRKKFNKPFRYRHDDA